jgi:transposase
VPDLSGGPGDDAGVLRAANARLRQVVDARNTEISVVRAQHEAEARALETLRAEVAELRARLQANSKNSSRPPSSDGLMKPAPKSLRKKTGRGPGRPRGQLGATLEMTGAPDEVIVHEPECCGGCG